MKALVLSLILVPVVALGACSSPTSDPSMDPFGSESEAGLDPSPSGSGGDASRPVEAGGDASGEDASGGDASGGDADGGDADGGDAGGGDAGGGDAGGDAGGRDAGPAPFTTAEIQAIVAARCASCHAPARASANLALPPDFRTHTVGVASQQVPRLQRIKKGDPKASYLFRKLVGDQSKVGGSGGRMPPAGPPLSAEQIERIGLWIQSQ